jgi:excisionase family DNA binding protein
VRMPPGRGLPDCPGPDGDLMPTPRFLTLDDVAEILNVSWSQAYALVRRKELIAIQIGGRGQWRVENEELERFIAQKYAEARAGAVSAEPAAEEQTEPDDTPAGPGGRRRS